MQEQLGERKRERRKRAGGAAAHTEPCSESCRLWMERLLRRSSVRTAFHGTDQCGAEEGSDHCDPYRAPETSITGGLQLACTVWVREAEEKGGGRCFYLLLVLTCLEYCR